MFFTAEIIVMILGIFLFTSTTFGTWGIFKNWGLVSRWLTSSLGASVALNPHGATFQSPDHAYQFVLSYTGNLVIFGIVFLGVYFWRQKQTPVNIPLTNNDYLSYPTSEALELIHQTKFTPISIKDKDTVQVLFDYDDEAKIVASELAGFPEEIREKVMLEIFNNPTQSVQQSRNKILLEALGRPDMIWNEELDLVVMKCRTASLKDIKELIRVFPILSNRMTPMHIFSKVVSEKETELFVLGPVGKNFR